MIAPDKTAAWDHLAAHADDVRDVAIKSLLTDELRNARLIANLGGVGFDFTRHRVSNETLDLLAALARQQGVADRFRAMMAGEKINITEGRAVWHTALRDPNGPAEVREALARMKVLAETLRADKTLRDVVHIGIGGSDLGPRFVCRALAKDADGPRVHIAANADGDDLDEVLRPLNPKTTIVIITSKTFTTHETMINMDVARAWLGDDTRLYAATANPPAANARGIDAARILPLWDWVGGRFSVWSSVGLCIALASGFDAFERFLAGAYDVDRHVAENETSIPLTMALLTVWYRNFLGFTAHAILPYSHRLSVFPEWIQQLEMESNGKTVDLQNRLIDYDTAPIIFGAAGTNAQHSFMQLVQQGHDVIPCDFIGVLDGIPRGDVVMANMRAQIDALSFGGGEPIYANLPGNRPATAITLPRIDAYTMGLLMAVWEHKTAALGFLWNINSFDQYGVELGKTLAKQRLAR